MNLKSSITRPVIISSLCLGLLLGGSLYAYKAKQIYDSPVQIPVNEPSYTEAVESLQYSVDQGSPNVPTAQSLSGAYLSSLFAQHNQQWDYASEYINELQHFNGDNKVILKKSILLDLGANNIDNAIKNAKQFLSIENDDNHSQALAHLLLIVDLFKNNELDNAKEQLLVMPSDGLSTFMQPIFNAWLMAADGKFDKNLLRGHRMHVMNAALIADYLGQTRQFKNILNMLSDYDDLSLLNQERVADMYYRSGEKEHAHKIYSYLNRLMPASQRISAKLKADDNIPDHLLLYKRSETIQSGIAYAIYDMADLLSTDKAYDSARIFLNLSMHLDSALSDAHILSASIALDTSDHYQALNQYDQIAENSPRYFETQLDKAKVYEKAGKVNMAEDLLQTLYKNTNYMSALVELADLQRRNAKFEHALANYNLLQSDHLNGEITAPFWFVHYMRGMVLEQLDRWDEARADLEKALEFYPNHPFLLNYLGYAMTDRGIEIDTALQLLERALSIEPHDGYILDSVGWTYYRLGQYEKSVPYLEEAVERMPADALVNEHLGDAYWQANRRLEARYQWKRARESHNIDDELLAQINEKLSKGLQDDLVIQSAQSLIKIDEKTTD